MVLALESMRSNTDFKYPGHMQIVIISCCDIVTSRYQAVKLQVPVISMALIYYFLPDRAVVCHTGLMFLMLPLPF